MSAFTETTPGHVAIAGPMTFVTATDLRREGRRVLRGSSGALVFDLGGVDKADSAGLALLVDWLAWAASHGRQLQFVNLPEPMRALAKITDVLPLVTAGR